MMMNVLTEGGTCYNKPQNEGGLVRGCDEAHAVSI